MVHKRVRCFAESDGAEWRLQHGDSSVGACGGRKRKVRHTRLGDITCGLFEVPPECSLVSATQRTATGVTPPQHVLILQVYFFLSQAPRPNQYSNLGETPNNHCSKWVVKIQLSTHKSRLESKRLSRTVAPILIIADCLWVKTVDCNVYGLAGPVF